jgi:hypothetical protein
MNKYILIGLGGTGSKIVDNLYGRVPQNMKDGFDVFSIDTDHDDQQNLKNIPLHGRVTISQNSTVGDFISQNGAREYEYLGRHHAVLQNNMGTGAGQMRQISRVAFETPNDSLDVITQAIAKQNNNIAADGGANSLSIILVTSICGGTGSGCSLQMAFFLKEYISQNILNAQPLIKMVSLMPGVFTQSEDVTLDDSQKRRIKANAYAFLTEWNTYNSIISGNRSMSSDDISKLEMYIGKVGGNKLMLDENRLVNNQLNDPIDYFITVDKFSSNNAVSYRTLKEYIKATEDYLFYACVSDLNGQVVSRVDNILNNLIQNHGQGRFLGIGTSRILYPKDKFEKIASILTYKEMISSQWFKIDESFNIALEQYYIRQETQAGGIKPILSEFFITTFDKYAVDKVSGNFFGLEKLKTQITITDDQTLGQSFLDKSEEFFNKLTEYIYISAENTSTVNGNLIGNFRSNLESALNGYLDSDDKANAVNHIENIVTRFDNSCKAVLSLPNTSGDIVNRLFDVSADSKINLDDNSSIGFYIFQSGNEMSIVSLRYFLYKLNRLIVNRFVSVYKYEKGHKSGQLKSIENEIESIRNADYFEKTKDQVESPREAIQTAEDLDKNVFNRLFGSNTKSFWETYEPNVTKEADLLDRHFKLSVEYDVLTKLSIRIDKMLGIIEKYMSNAGKREVNNQLQNDIENACATDYDSLSSFREVFSKPEQRVDFIDTYRGRNANSYRELKRETNITATKHIFSVSKDIINTTERSQSSLDLDSLSLDPTNVIMSLNQSFIEKGIFDINIIKALGEEAIYNDVTLSEHVENQLRALHNLADPLISVNRNIDQLATLKYYSVSSSVMDYIANNRLNSIDLGNVNNGKVKDGYAITNVISDYEIVRNNVTYGISLNNMNQFTATNDLSLRSLDGSDNCYGEYLKSYLFERAQKWNSDSGSVHIDERWEEMGLLTSIDDKVNQLMNKALSAAYIRGLAYGVLKHDSNKQQGYWIYNPSENSLFKDSVILEGSHRLNTSQTFYDLYMGLKSNFGVVYELARIDKESMYFDHILQDRKNGVDVWYGSKLIGDFMEGRHFYKPLPKTNLNLLDCILGLPRSQDKNIEVEAIAKDLLDAWFDMIAVFHESTYGKKLDSPQRLRNTINRYTENSYFWKNRDYNRPFVEKIEGLINARI